MLELVVNSAGASHFVPQNGTNCHDKIVAKSRASVSPALGSGLSPGVTYENYLICIFMNVNENFKNKVRIIDKKENLCNLFIKSVIS